ncbi:MAG: hypothetical protein GX267_04625 [Fibrobacter sp.]|jgi:hypothetical protein|nr:hypothetical protein [Fibrobacter sp.]
MIRSISKLFSDRTHPTTYFGESNSSKIKHNDQCIAIKKKDQSSKEDLLLGGSFAHTPRPLPPKFDSIAEMLMDQANTSPEQDSFDCQQLFLKLSQNRYTLQKEEPFSSQEIFQQLRQLSDLLNSILSEYTLTGNYSSSFLREIIHNLCLDLNVLLVNLDNQLKTESSY